jgi:hypothetical protein
MEMFQLKENKTSTRNWEQYKNTTKGQKIKTFAKLGN